ncbi:MAG TPA: immunoglobulin domain-containing protein, partial [Pirellula sp.]|nr:immunoglobulin domain-containing protein [Pirellula sp.]
MIFTTTDGINFTANSLGTDATNANFQEGIAFGTGNTFWAKKIGAPLRYMSFDLGTLSATTIASFDTSTLPGTLNLGPIAVDNTNQLLAAIEVISGTTGSEKVFLYDIANPSRPVLLDVKSYNPNNANASAPPGYLDFNNGKLYSHVINNGLIAFTNEVVTIPSPTILTQPTPFTRVTSGKQVVLSVLAYPAVSYQWQKSGTNLVGETNASLIFTNIQTANIGTYRVVVSNSTSSATSDNAQVDVVNLADFYHFNTLWTAKPASTNYVTTAGGGTPNERNIAYNALSNQVLVVRSVVGTTNAPSSDFAIHVVDGNTGQKLYTLNTNGIRTVASEIAGSNPLFLDGIAVADDGAIYACNLTPNAGGGGTVTPFNTNKYFHVYRWADSNPNTQPVIIFEGDPGGQSGNFRWGDVMAVRGSGANTQILLDN